MKHSAFITLFLVVGIFTMYGHPHMWIDSEVELVVTGTTIDGIRITWGFDPGFKEMVVIDYDENANGKLEGSEVASIEAEAFSNLINYHYFTRIFWDGGEIPVGEAREFTAWLSADGTLWYRFFIPIKKVLPNKSVVMDIFQYDPSFFADVVFESWKFPPSISGFTLGHNLEAVPAFAIYDGLIIPKRLRLFIAKVGSQGLPLPPPEYQPDPFSGTQKSWRNRASPPILYP